MSAIYDNWEQLVQATLRRERLQLRHLSRIDSCTTSDSDESFSLTSRLSESSLGFVTLAYSFTYQQILQATSSFSTKNLIKRGSSGDFFRGDFAVSLMFSGNNKFLAPGSSLVVVKRIDLKSVGDREAYLSELHFWNKVWISRFSPFLGHCLEKEEEEFLVYKYMCNGDLSSSLLIKKNVTKGEGLKSLDWITWMKIATEAAEALVSPEWVIEID